MLSLSIAARFLRSSRGQTSLIIAGIMMAYGESGSQVMLRIITRLGGLRAITPKVIENLYEEER